MILDNILNSQKYVTVHPNFNTAFDFLLNYTGKESGRYELGNCVFALVQAYNTKDEKDCKWETHKNYIDLQFVYKGNETFGVGKMTNMKVTTLYNPDKDVAFYLGSGSDLKLSDGDFVIVFPWDVHKPQMGNGSYVDKIVIKIPY